MEQNLPEKLREESPVGVGDSCDLHSGYRIFQKVSIFLNYGMQSC